MAYLKRVWTDSPLEEVTFEDCNRWEEGIESNDKAIADIKDTEKEGSIAKQIEDMNDPTKEGSLAKKIADAEEQINVLNNDRGYLNSNYLSIEGIDLNNITDNGIYSYNAWKEYVNGVTTSSGYVVGNMIVCQDTNGGVTQIVLSNWSGNGIFIRHKTSEGTWSNWDTLVTSTMLQSAIDALNA